MTLEIKFEHSKQQQLLRLIDWLKEIGLVKSYKVAAPATNGVSKGEVFLTNMLQKAEADFANGDTMTTEEVNSNLEILLREHK